MKKILLLVSVLWLSFGAAVAQSNRCGTMENHELMKAIDPGFEGRLNGIEQLIQQRMANDKTWKTTGTITIPVVFHILYSTNNTTQNISNARINAQMDVLNQDFSATNVDVTNVPSVFQANVAPTGIQFCLAVQDPNGNTTDGIIRKQTSTTSFSQNNGIKFDAQGGDNAWPATSYLNIWVGNLSGGLLGYAQFPGGAAATDGVVVLNGTVGGPGALGTTSSYNRGRTATHEIGHWLNLRHINGDSNCGNDFVTDTPTQSNLNFGCPSFPQLSCSSGPNGAMYMNYMDYTDDACMYMFTSGQGTRMNAAITASRPTILNSLGCVPVIAGAPTANFSASSTNLLVGTSINFTDLSAGSPTSWVWTFAGGTPGASSMQNPTSITYNTAGTYTVTLIASNATGTDTETKTAYINVTQGGLVCDTLENFPATGTPTLYASTVGYVSGHNDYLDVAKADYFSQPVAPNSQITNALIAFGVATASNTTNTFDVTVWDNTGASGSPGAEMGTTTVTYSQAAADVMGGNLTLATFNPPVDVTGPFYLGIEFDYIIGDTLAILNTLDGEVTPNTAWEQFSSFDWHAFSETPTSWGLDVSMAIFPVVCPTNSTNNPVQNGIALYPNPTQGFLMIHNSNLVSEKATVSVVNTIGQIVMTTDFNNFSGTHRLDLTDLSNGLYFVEIKTASSNSVYRIMLDK
ncbi:MAG: M43 family zinc metalloprotease [Bacteroidota bacterium]|nr:M43 family zinc metalloprotease [Bacteroidota bacterium]